MNRIYNTLQSLAEQGRKALVPYIVCGDPTPNATLPMLLALAENGADIIELGVPFSDPMAEGPVIQKGHERALAQGMSLLQTLKIVSQFRQTNQHTPIVLMGYANPIERMGYQRFVEQAGAAGVDGVLTVDLPPEEAEEFNALLKKGNMENIFLIAPTTTREREEMITQLAGGYLYYVSLKGVTGAGHLDLDSVKTKVSEIKTLTSLPVCVGFGIKDPTSAAAICEVADGAVVGSVLVDKIAQLNMAGEISSDRIAGEVSAIIKEMRTAIDQLGKN